MAIAEAPGGGDILDYDGAGDWVIREPYTAAGGGVIGESPPATVTEFMLTPFDDLIYNDEEGCRASELDPGQGHRVHDLPCRTMTAVERSV